MPAPPKTDHSAAEKSAAEKSAEKRAPNPLLDVPPQLGPERAVLRRLACSLGEVLTPLEVAPGAVGAYRAATAPAPVLALLDYVEALERQLAGARGFYQDNVQALLAGWQEDCHGQSSTPFFELKCRELTSRGLDYTAEPVERPQPWPAATPPPAFGGLENGRIIAREEPVTAAFSVALAPFYDSF